MENREIVVVGGGPVGLSLGLGLARHGMDVVVLEKEPGTASHSRAPAIWPGTQEILARMGVLERFFETGLVLPTVTLWDADQQRRLMRLPLRDLRAETDFPQLLIVPQSRTERILHEALIEAGGEVRFSTEVLGVEQDAGEVRVRCRREGREQWLRTSFVAGCDGARSLVRREIGASFDGITYDARAALADIVPHRDEDLPFPRLTTIPQLAIAVRIDLRLWRLILPFSEKDTRHTEQRVHDAVRSLFPGTGYETVWQSEFRLHRRISSRFADGRIALAGDAAHLNSPVGGQGMNAGIRDAALLTEALLLALRDAPEALVEYARGRREAIEQGVNPFTGALTRVLLFGDGFLVRTALGAGRMLLHIRPLRRRFLRRLAMLDRPRSR